VAGEALRLIRVTYGAEGGGGRVAAWCVGLVDFVRDVEGSKRTRLSSLDAGIFCDKTRVCWAISLQ
jgi:hypothetical protein